MSVDAASTAAPITTTQSSAASTAPDAKPQPPASPGTSSSPPSPGDAGPSREERVRSLVERARRDRKLAERAPEPAPKPEATKAEEPKTERANSPESSDTSAPKPADDGDSAMAKRMARIASAEAKARKEREAFEAERRAHTERLAKAQSIEEALTKGDKLAALRAVFNDDDLHSLYQRELTDWILSRPAGGAPSKEDVDAMVAKRVRDELESAKKAEVDARDRRAGEIKDSYIKTIDRVFSAAPTKWPLIAARGVTPQDIHTLVEAEYAKSGRALAPEEVLDHFQKAFEAQLEAAGYARKSTTESGTKSPSTTVNSQWTRDNGAPENVDWSKLSVKESREAIKRKYFSR